MSNEEVVRRIKEQKRAEQIKQQDVPVKFSFKWTYDNLLNDLLESFVCCHFC